MKSEAEEYVVKAPNGIWRYYRRVPTEIQPLIKKQHVKVSLKTRDREAAVELARAVHDKTLDLWRSLSAQLHAGPLPVAQQHPQVVSRKGMTEMEEYLEAKRCAEALGFTYKPMAEILSTESDELIERRTHTALFYARKEHRRQ